MTEPMIFKKTKLLRDFSQTNKLIHGWPKTGKTTFAAQQKTLDGREPLFIATEDGHHALEVYSQRVTSWDGFKKLVEIIVKNQEILRKQHSCLVIDLISDLDQWCQEYVAKKKGVEHLADLDFGKGFSLAKQEFQSAIHQLLSVLPVTFICHSAEKELQWNNEKVKVQAPALSKSALEFVNGKVDIIMWVIPANNKKLTPELTMRNTTTAIAGSRYKQLVKNFPFYPDDPARTYADVQKAFAGTAVPGLEQEEDQEVATKKAQPVAAAK